MTYKCDGCGTVYCPHCDPGPCPGCGVDTYNGERESQLMRDLRARAEAAEQECARLRAYNSLTVRELLQEPPIPVLRLDEAAADGWAEDWCDFATALARVEAGRWAG